MENVQEILLALKDQALEATKNNDGEFYRNYLADDAVAIVPFGVFNKEAIVKQMASSESQFKSVKIEDTQAIVLTPESGVVTYKATFEAAQVANQLTAYVTTIYTKRDGKWQGVFYQQTPMRPSKK